MKLIIQSAVTIPDGALAPLSSLVGGAAPRRLDAYAFAFDVASSGRRQAVAAWCRQQRLDHAFIAPRRLDAFRLLVMDMDSTLITIECIDEIADFCGLKKEVSAITEAAMRGEILNFDDSLKRRVALLKGLDASVLERVYTERLALSPGAQALMAGAHAAGLRVLLVSGGFTFFTDRLKTRLGLDFTRANTLDIVDGRLTGTVSGAIVNAAEKARVLEQTCREIGALPSQAIAMGDGSNDLQMMAVAGFSVAFRAKPVVREAATAALDFAGLDGLLRLFD